MKTRALCLLLACSGFASEPLPLGSRRELLVDDHLIASMEQVTLKMHTPDAQEVALVCDAPWEGNTSGYFTLFQDGDIFRCYYRGTHYDEATKKGAHAETTCYAESRDGIAWTKPKLGLVEFNGSKENNIVLIGEGCTNFAPFKDTNPNCPPESRYKALASTGDNTTRKLKPSLQAYQSADGLRWSRMREEPVISAGSFDSQNTAYYDAERREYRAYWRYFTGGYTDERGWAPKGVRAIRTATSKDFLTWENQADLAYGKDAPLAQLYTNAVRPYARAPHLFIGFPTRYQPKHEQVEPVLMTSRDGVNFKRWEEPLIPITAPKDRDWNRSNYMTLGVLSLPGKERELSVYATEAYYKGPGSRVRRFTFRVDGFVSANATEGTLITKPLTFTGAKLSLNIVSKGATRVEVQDAAGVPLPGFALEDCAPITGDFIDHAVTWKGGSLAAIAGKTVRLRFAMQQADLFALQFVSEDKLARLPQPWVKPIHRITFDEYEATLKYWAAQHPGLFTFQKRGASHEGQPVYLVKITDANVPDVDKQVALVSALHGGPERSGTTTTLKLIEWLLGDSDLAKETRRKQVVLLVPIANPYAFFTTDRFTNKERIDLYDPQIGYWDLPKLKLAVPQRTPELAAFLGIVDEFQPDVHLDLHGTGLQAFPEDGLGDRTMRQGQTMFEVSACSYSNCGVRPWDPRVTEAMVRAGQEAGYGSDRAEADAQRCFYNPDHDMFRSRLWIAPRPQRFRTMFYGYMKYHTMISTTEIGWEESGVARVRGVLALGNKQWLDEKFSGYPVTRVRARAGRFITAYGRNASERRESRVELWTRQPAFADGMMYPEYAGRATYVCAVTPKGMAALDNDPAKFIANLRELPGVNADAIERFVKLGPEYKFTSDPREATTGDPIQNGIGFRLRVPYRAPELLDVSVNGHSLKPSSTDGYEAWYADGYTQVQIHLPPEKTRTMDLYVVTCAYDGNEKRSYGWKPPEAVMRQLQSK